MIGYPATNFFGSNVLSRSCLNCFPENNFMFIVADKSFLSGLGITEDEFHAMTWLSSWAVDGDHNSHDSSLEVDDTSCDIR
jgi:hypothetical protein